jgi:hypothetical protein
LDRHRDNLGGCVQQERGVSDGNRAVVWVWSSSVLNAEIVFLSQEGGMGVARLNDSPLLEARMIAECED